MIWHAIWFSFGAICGMGAMCMVVIAREAKRADAGEKYLEDLKRRYGK